jgi:hypothetical protein
LSTGWIDSNTWWWKLWLRFLKHPNEFLNWIKQWQAC